MEESNFFNNLKETFDALVSEDNINQTIDNRSFVHAVRRGKIDDVLDMLKNGQDINIYSIGQRTALLLSLSKKNEEMVDLLLSHGADPYKSANDAYKTTPIDTIVNHGLTTMLKLFQKYKVDFNKIDEKGETALYKAVAENKPDMVECLLRWGCDPLLAGNDKMSPVTLAFKRGNQEVLRQLLQHKDVIKYINTPEKLGLPAEPFLPTVIENGVSKTLSVLLEQGVSINIYSNDGQTPLHKAVEAGDLKTASLLVESGVDLNSMPRKSDGYLPLHAACDVWRWQENKTPEMLKTLLFAGANPNIVENKRNTTPIMILLKNDNLTNLPECIDILLEYNSAVNVYDKDGKTPLLYAMNLNRDKDKIVVEKLLKSGANPNLTEKETGRTPLHHAVLNGDEKDIKLFLSYDANPLLKDKEGKSAIDLAEGVYRKILIESINKSYKQSFDNTPNDLPRKKSGGNNISP